MKRIDLSPTPWTYRFVNSARPHYEIVDRNDIAMATTMLLTPDIRLMIAAPEMLATLEQLHAMYYDWSATVFDLIAIRRILNTALERARGEP